MNISQDTTRKNSKIVYFLIFIYMLMQMRCWIGFGGIAYMFQLAFPIIMFLLSIVGKVKFEFKTKYLICAFIVWATLVYTVKASMNMNGLIEKAFPAVGILFILSVPDDYKEGLLSFVVKWFGFIIACALPIYLLSTFTNVPGLGSIMADYGSKDITAGLYENYIFYIRSLEHNTANGFLRFNGPFIEPGDLGCVSAFILMAAQFDFKKYKNLKYILIGVFASLSLAGLTLTLMGNLFIIYSKNRISLRYVLIVFTILYGGFLFSKYYNGGDNFLNEAVVSRLQNDEDKGFAGNNRTSLLMDVYFFDMWSDLQLVMYGYDKETSASIIEEGKTSGAGFVRQMVIAGLIGVLGLVLPYLIIYIKAQKRKYALLFFLLFLFYMYQRCDAYWPAFILSYVCGIAINDREIA